MLPPWYLVLQHPVPSVQVPWNVIHGTFVTQGRQWRSGAFEWKSSWVCPSNASGVDNTRWPSDKVARNYAVILLQPGPGPTHPLTFEHDLEISLDTHSQQNVFYSRVQVWLKLLQSVIRSWLQRPFILTQVKAFIFNPLWFSPNQNPVSHQKIALVLSVLNFDK